MAFNRPIILQEIWHVIHVSKAEWMETMKICEEKKKDDWSTGFVDYIQQIHFKIVGLNSEVATRYELYEASLYVLRLFSVLM